MAGSPHTPLSTGSWLHVLCAGAGGRVMWCWVLTCLFRFCCECARRLRCGEIKPCSSPSFWRGRHFPGRERASLPAEQQSTQSYTCALITERRKGIFDDSRACGGYWRRVVHFSLPFGSGTSCTWFTIKVGGDANQFQQSEDWSESAPNSFGWEHQTGASPEKKNL